MSDYIKVGLLLAVPFSIAVFCMWWFTRTPKPKTFKDAKSWEKFEDKGGGS